MPLARWHMAMLMLDRTTPDLIRASIAGSGADLPMEVGSSRPITRWIVRELLTASVPPDTVALT
jgi:hypothetical protein